MSVFEEDPDCLVGTYCRISFGLIKEGIFPLLNTVLTTTNIMFYAGFRQEQPMV